MVQMSRSELRRIRKALGVRQHELSRLLGRSAATVGNWEHGIGRIPDELKPTIREKLRELLAAKVEHLKKLQQELAA